MLRSMTGYGKGQAAGELGTITVEVRSVNHRYGEVSVRMPRQFLALENDVKRVVSSRLKRGKIDVYVQWEALGGATQPQVDHQLARVYFEAFSKLTKELGTLGQVPLDLVINQKGVLCDQTVELDEEQGRALILAALETAVAAIDAMRLREGEALGQDLRERRQQVAEWVARIGERSPQVVAEYRLKLKARLDQLLEGVEMDEARLAQEVALMADRCDVTEELVRLASHFTQFGEALRLDEAVGRKLDFLMQEMNREVNTIGSKSSDAEVTSLVIRIKAEMEKMREQVQNIE